MSYLSVLLGNAYKEGMTEEEISEALQNLQTDKGNEMTKLKNALSKANSEAADYKKQLRAKMSEEEANAIAQKETLEQLEKENNDLKRSIALSESTGKLLAMGYDESLASSTAVAMLDGDMETVMKNQSTYLESKKKEILAEKMKDTPRPAGGAGDGGGIDYKEKIAASMANGDLSGAAYYTRLAQEMGE